MKRQLFSLFIMILLAVSATAQKKFSVYAIGFYNQENLFDYIHDEGKDDYEFTPEGSYQWNEMKYKSKLQNMAQVLSEMGTDVLPNIGCAVIGLSEVENQRVMADLVTQPALAQRGYKYVHIEGPDLRGIDCAMLYNPRIFTVTGQKLIPYIYQRPEDNARPTRGFLTVTGTMAGEEMGFIICHWPSRSVGQEYRELAAQQVKNIKDSLIYNNPAMNVIIMGDMNDNPTSKSVREILSAKSEQNEVESGDMYNPWYNILVRASFGTLRHRGKWALFDQILLSPNLIGKTDAKYLGTLKFWKNQIFHRSYLFQEDGRNRGELKRTTSDGVWLNGYSDHLPVIVYLTKEIY